MVLQGLDAWVKIVATVTTKVPTNRFGAEFNHYTHKVHQHHYL